MTKTILVYPDCEDGIKIPLRRNSEIFSDENKHSCTQFIWMEVYFVETANTQDHSM